MGVRAEARASEVAPLVHCSADGDNKRKYLGRACLSTLEVQVNEEKCWEVVMLDAREEVSVERIESGEMGIVARVLAEAFAEDPVFLWAMPKASTRLADATAFFTFYLRRVNPQCREVFATSDRSAVAVVSSVDLSDRKRFQSSGETPALLNAKSSVADYFRWIETFRPRVDHRYLEFIGILPAYHSKGRGSVLLGHLLSMADRQGLPFWCWSSNPRNLPYYYRLGFVAGPELRWNDETPAVTPLLREPKAVDGDHSGKKNGGAAPS